MLRSEVVLNLCFILYFKNDILSPYHITSLQSCTLQWRKPWWLSFIEY